MVSATLNDEGIYQSLEGLPNSVGNKKKKKSKKSKRLEVADYEEDDLDLVMNNVSAMARIKEEDDLNPNDAKYANQPLDFEHLAKDQKNVHPNDDFVEDF